MEKTRFARTFDWHPGCSPECGPVNMNCDAGPPPADVDTFADVPVNIEVRVGEVALTVDQLLRLDAGSTVITESPAGETLDLLAENVLLASVEVVVTGDRIALRVGDLLPRPRPSLGSAL